MPPRLKSDYALYMKIGIHGLDGRAAALGLLLVEAGYDVCSGDNSPALSTCDLLMFAGPRERNTDELLTQLGKGTKGTVIVDARREGQSPPSPGVVRASLTAVRSGASVFLGGGDVGAVGLVRKVFLTAGCLIVEGDPSAKPNRPATSKARASVRSPRYVA